MNRKAKGTRKERCSYLSSQGRQCRGNGVHKEAYAGHDSYYNGIGKDSLSYVRIYLCEKHKELEK